MTEQPDALSSMNAARNGPANTCPASRHAAMIAEALITGQGYPMLTEDPTHCGETIAAVVEALWTARSKLIEADRYIASSRPPNQRLNAELDALVSDLRDHANKLPALWPDKAADAITTLRTQLANALAINEELRAAVAIAEDYAHRAESERAAQIEVDAGIVTGFLASWDDANINGSSLRIVLDAIRAQPHDRTALDAVRRAAKVDARKEAADFIEAAPIRTRQQDRAAILALIGEGV